MARLFKPTITRYADSHGKRCTKGDPGARKKRVKSKVWRGEYRDADGILRTKSLCTNKTASRQMLAELERRAELEKAGLASPFEDHAKQPLSVHLDEFEQHLLNQNNTVDYCRQKATRARRIFEECLFRYIRDIAASSVHSCLAELRQRDGMSDQTTRHYLSAVKQFTRWLVRDRRTDDDRLAHLNYNRGRKVQQTFERREMNADEIRRLFHATRTGAKHHGMTGESRYMLYCAAMGTGFSHASFIQS